MQKSDGAKLNKPESSLHLGISASHSKPSAAEFICGLLVDRKP